jgi:hypothetical protein
MKIDVFHVLFRGASYRRTLWQNAGVVATPSGLIPFDQIPKTSNE